LTFSAIIDSLIIEHDSEVFPLVQRVSKALFGNQDRLVVAAAVATADPGSIFGRHLADQIGIVDARVGPHLAAFERADLLVRLPKLGGDQRVYFERRDSTFWPLCERLCEEVVARETA
jgi:hypothetical protein